MIRETAKPWSRVFSMGWGAARGCRGAADAHLEWVVWVRDVSSGSIGGAGFVTARPLFRSLGLAAVVPVRVCS